MTSDWNQECRTSCAHWSTCTHDARQISGQGRRPGYLGRVSWLCDNSAANPGRLGRVGLPVEQVAAPLSICNGRRHLHPPVGLTVVCRAAKPTRPPGAGRVRGMAEAPARGEATAPVMWMPVGKSCFDRKNPRLFLDKNLEELDEPELVRLLWREFAVDELALSIASNGYFEHEPLFVARENGKYVVVEGNRRLAAVKLLLDAQLRRSVGATDLPQITDERRQQLLELPVILTARQEIWHYIGFKHVNGSQSWQSYAKAQYIAWVHNDLGQPLDEIARRIGDRHSTVKRLYRGLMVLRQAESSGQFDLDDRWKKHFSFSHLYTGLDYHNIQELLEIDNESSFRPDPVPQERIEALGDLCLWLYGRQSTDTRPLVQSQNPDLRRLDTAIGSSPGLIALRRGLPLDLVMDISTGDEELFKGHLIEARHRLQEARGKQLTGDQGDADTLRLANEILELADRLVSDMEYHRRAERADRRRSRTSR